MERNQQMTLKMWNLFKYANEGKRGGQKNDEKGKIISL